MSGWISVSERLPDNLDSEVTVDCLVFMDGIIYQGFYMHDCESWFDTDGDDLCGHPTHWQPLPEPPK